MQRFFLQHHSFGGDLVGIATNCMYIQLSDLKLFSATFHEQNASCNTDRMQPGHTSVCNTLHHSTTMHVLDTKKQPPPPDVGWLDVLLLFFGSNKREVRCF